MARAAAANKKRSRSATAAAAPTAGAASKKRVPATKAAKARANVSDDEVNAESTPGDSSDDDDSMDQTATEEEEEEENNDVETNDETGTASDSANSDDVESDAPAPVTKRARKSVAAKKPLKAAVVKKPIATTRTKSAAAASTNKRRGKAVAATAATKKAPVVKKRRGRSDEDKLRENAPMSEPFYTETGSDWDGQDIDFDELSALRSMWELPSACHILWLLQTPLTLRFSHKLLDFEAALLEPTNSRLLEDVFTKLLLKKSERDCLSAGIGLKYEWWSKQLREYYLALYDKWYALLRKAGEDVPTSFSDDSDSEGDANALVDVELSDDEWLALDILNARLASLGKECPLKHKSFADLSVPLRCKILHNLCEAVIDDPRNTEHVRMMEEDDMRVEPLGRDRAGNLFYFFPQFYAERRLYRLNVTTRAWDLWAKGDAGFRLLLAALQSLKGRKVPGEQTLLEHVEVIVEQLDDEAVEQARAAERASKRAALDAIPRKRSVRIQVKQIEQLEQQRLDVETKQQLTLDELADLKRAELLRKVENEAAREEREKAKDAERLATEQRERDAAAAERELRRLRRLEKEREDDMALQQMEIERQKEREARELRALQRKAAEDAAEAQDAIDAAAKVETAAGDSK